LIEQISRKKHSDRFFAYRQLGKRRVESKTLHLAFSKLPGFHSEFVGGIMEIEGFSKGALMLPFPYGRGREGNGGIPFEMNDVIRHRFFFLFLL
jgi:hypothetical protein